MKHNNDGNHTEEGPLSWLDLRGQLRARYGQPTGYSLRATGYGGYSHYGHAYGRYGCD